MRIENDQVRAVVIGAGIFAVFALGVLLPLHWQRGKYHDRIAKAETTLGIDLKEATGLSKLNTEVTQLRQVIRGAQQYVPQDDELADVLRGLSESLTAFGIIERDMSTRTTQHYANYSVIPVQLEFRSSYPSTHGVLQKIERMRRLIRIDEMEVIGDEDDETQPLRVKLALSTFIAREVESDAE